jgi:putative MATE family efflux protein
MVRARSGPLVRAWRLLREALGGTNQNFTQGSLSRGIALLAIPTMAEMGMESTFSLVDGIWVSRLGAASVAALGLTDALLILVFSVALGLSMAATAAVARRIGEDNRDAAAVAAVQGIGAAAVISLLIGAAGAHYAVPLLTLMHAPPEVIGAGAGYTRVLLGTNVVVMLLFLTNGVFRGAGDAAIAMRTLWLANLINLALDPCFIYGLAFFPKLGATGAAVATTIGRGTGVLYQFWVLARGRSRIEVAARHLRLDWPVMRRLLRVGGVAMVQYFISTASWLTLVRINALFGSIAIAGYTVAIRIIMFSILPSWGIVSAAATLVGQNLGAKRPDRSERAVWMAGTYNMIFLSGIAAIFFAAAPWIAGWFGSDPRVQEVAVRALRTISIGYPFYAWGMTMEQAFNGAGDTATPTWINLGCYWMLQIPLAWWMSQSTSLGPRGVYLAICVAESVLAVVAMLVFRRGGWKLARV